jgi:hypothetical protein
VKEGRGDKHHRDRLRQSVEEAAEMPEVGDYILQKRDMYELESKLNNWKKKVEIMEMAARRARTRSLLLEKQMTI